MSDRTTDADVLTYYEWCAAQPERDTGATLAGALLPRWEQDGYGREMLRRRWFVWLKRQP